MRHLSIFIHDLRYSVPTLRFDVGVAPGQEREVAARILAEDAHYRAVELREGDQVVFHLEASMPVAAAKPSSQEGARHEV